MSQSLNGIQNGKPVIYLTNRRQGNALNANPAQKSSPPSRPLPAIPNPIEIISYGSGPLSCTHYSNSIKGPKKFEITLIEQKDPIYQLLHSDLLQPILLNSNPKDVCAVKSINKDLSERSLHCISQQECKLLSAYLTFLAKNLGDEYQAVILDLIQKINHSNLKDLLEVKGLLLDTRETVLNLLKDLPQEKLNVLEHQVANVDNPLFFDGIFHLVKIYQKIDEIKGLKNDARAREKVVVAVVDQLFELKMFDKAIKVAGSSGLLESPSIIKIAQYFLDEGKLEKSFDLVKDCQGKSKVKIAKEICLKVLELGNLNQFDHLTSEMVKAYHNALRHERFWSRDALKDQEDALALFAGKLVTAGMLSEALELMTQIRGYSARRYACNEILAALIELKKFDTLIMAEINASDVESKYREIFNAQLHKLIDTKGIKPIFDAAIKLANSITNEASRNKAIQQVAIFWGRTISTEDTNELKKVLELIRTIPDKSLQDGVLSAISERFCNFSEYFTATFLARMITDSAKKEEVLKYIEKAQLRGY